MVKRFGFFKNSFLLLCFFYSGTSYATVVTCKGLLSEPPVISFGTPYGLNETQVSEMRADIQTAIQFSMRYFKVPAEVKVSPQARNNHGYFPHYSELTDRITYTYQFGKMVDGQFLTRKSRRLARDIFYHEFGHLLFRHNAGMITDFIDLYKEHYILKIREGLKPTYPSEPLLREYISAYNELFADVFAVIVSHNLRAMVAGEYTMYREKDLVGKFHASPKQILRARDFSKKIDVETWKDNEAHVAFAPARTAFTEDPFAIYMFKNHPERLAKIALDAINFELRTLFSDDIAEMPMLTIPQLNQRMIDTMKAFLEKEKETSLRR